MTRKRDRSISAKLTRMNMFVSAFALVLACAVLVACDWITYRQTMVRQLSVEAQIAGYNCISALVFNDPVSARKTLAAVRAAPRVFSAAVYRPDGRLFAEFERGPRLRARGRPRIAPGVIEVYQFEHRELDLERRIVFQGRPLGAILIRCGLQEMRIRLERYAIVLAAVLGGSLGVAFVLSAV
ncbi:MAG: CHASE sensor domain-containing protein, partial [Terriglobia bacterium]